MLKAATSVIGLKTLRFFKGISGIRFKEEFDSLKVSTIRLILSMKKILNLLQRLNFESWLGSDIVSLDFPRKPFKWL